MPDSPFPARLLRYDDCLLQADVFNVGVEQFDVLPGEPGYRKVVASGHDPLYRNPQKNMRPQPVCR